MAFSTDVDSCLFADDTIFSLSLPGAHFDSTLSLFNKKIETLLNWIKLNQLIINWSKTKLMCISSKKCNIVTNSVIIDENQVEIVNSFKLIGVHIDRWLDFEFHIAEMVKSVNKKLFSLKNLKFLSIKTKLHFFKAFVLPHFDYCSSIFVFFNKRLIHKTEKFFNLCLYRLFNFKLLYLNTEEQFNFLSKYNIFPLQMRIFIKYELFFK